MLKINFLALTASLKSRRQLALENVALRHQLEVLQRNAKRPRLRPSDRAFWAVLTRILPDWKRHLTIVQPGTIIRWHRAGWRLYWRWRSKSGPGPPKMSAEIRALIRRMSLENRLWGAPRIHGSHGHVQYPLRLPYSVARSKTDPSFQCDDEPEFRLDEFAADSSVSVCFGPSVLDSGSG